MLMFPTVMSGDLIEGEGGCLECFSRIRKDLESGAQS